MSLDSDVGTDGFLGEDQALRFSVIIPVFNRSGPLHQLLDALAKQKFPREDFEVLVCDDGSTEDISAVVQTAAETSKLQVTCLRQSWSGPGGARNLGLSHAKGELIAFTDSDCIPAPDWLAAFDRAFASPDIKIAGGSIAYRDAEHLSGRCINFLNASTLGGAGGADPRSRVHMDYYPRTMNLAVRRSLALTAGGFPPYGNGEDVVFVHHACELVLKKAVRFVAGASVLHNEQRTLAQAFSVSLRRGVARVRLLRPHGIHQAVHALPSALVVYLLAWIGFAATGSVVTAPTAVPLALYAIILGVLAVQGCVDMKDWRALAGIPAYAVALHLGHGVGYLGGYLGLLHAKGEHMLATKVVEGSSSEGEERKAGRQKVGLTPR